ncbi:carbamoyl-phosphate synthase large subunit [Helicobacter saguini]|uniref:Carbamoyl phosphate synthase large chain n=1 Tax=Helicobacter saguini TaxID=1548018 RepID=A0A347VHH6_9HELI|nr:carbamoyl-phosphate synthase large subunit [Helicobacter saguini]MWV62294.1 carbamoyl-phosphate synthase large subunit [Helicobacter saguini]MWV67033.1 carbamoyl-phosphate synthase large subunit [Helicobacter saguini]MWV69382.1 carbamoyl-phosphate synthase large subunit [Helicobacter saguini]MWV71063.1 carbamoyl-phosphate synthase large subunit [Helicobacter saguini]TLD95035.1 carbamoyl-phosphate synthase large subunit [Helicobacter saguini]
MAARSDIKNILLIGSGPIVIGQACEFDYSGTQAVKTLKSLGYKVVLINSNPATIMTDPDFADATYIEPINEEIIADIIKKEKIDAILPTMGGQTALNVAMSMHEKGMLKNVKFLGANPEAIKKGEDRQAFKEAMLKIGMDLPKSAYAYNEEEALNAAQTIGFPLIIRASYTLAGGGSGVAYNIDEFKILAKNGLLASPINEILIEESLLGWKEYEMEVIRDKNDNCIIVCSIENLDPMGVHTGDSITIAPALTLTDKEYQRMRDASFKILREIGVDTGGSNVQFAINPANGRMTVIEMNPRVSRSSALASKATGYPIAKVATMLAVGFTLDEITNDITGTPASFEPSIDYIVTKIPRFTFEKFPLADSTLSTSMKSIGEVMAIGGTFKESLQKALCSLEIGLFGFNRICTDLDVVKKEIRRPNASRLLYIAEGFGLGMNVDSIHELCKIDKWFLNEIKEIIESENLITSEILRNASLMRKIKSQGYSDKNIAYWLNENENLEISESEIYQTRLNLGVVAKYLEVDTCSAEFPSLTSYLYSSIGDFENIESKFIESKFIESNLQNLDSINAKDSNNLSPTHHPTNKKDSNHTPTHHKDSILIIGGGPNRIGQGIEFDYCCVHASFALKDLGIKSIMYNCNPETVSTDYDTSDTLYFEPIDFEHVRAVIEREKPSGIIVHFGGQTPLKLANSLSKINAKIIGTSAKVIDIAEDREKFAKFINRLGLKQPQNGIAFDKEQAFSIANNIGFPVLVRPSYVLGGRAMRIVYDNEELKLYMDEVLRVSENSPVLIDKFLESALELDVDCVSDGESVYIGGIMEHIEEAGIHSGDSASVLPSLHISAEMKDEIESTTAKIALELGVIGLMNVQYAIYKDSLYLIEVNPRASRTVPFVSKATGIPLAKVATRVMYHSSSFENTRMLSTKDVNAKKDSKNIESILLEALRFYDKYSVITQKDSKIYTHKHLNYSNVKESVFPFNKLPGADLLLGPEMKSTGEVMGMGENFAIAFAKSQLASKNPLPKCGKIFISLRNSDKKHAVALAKGFSECGYEIVATLGTNKILNEAGVHSQGVLKVSEGRPHINDMIANKEISMVINTTSNKDKQDARLIRQAVLRANIPYFTTISGANSALISMQEISTDSKDSKHSKTTESKIFKAKSLQKYLES